VPGAEGHRLRRLTARRYQAGLANREAPIRSTPPPRDLGRGLFFSTTKLANQGALDLFGRKCFPSIDLGKHWRDNASHWTLLALIASAAVVIGVILCRHAFSL
jgi:hypothetical protein